MNEPDGPSRPNRVTVLLGALGDPEVMAVDSRRTLDLGRESVWLVVRGELEVFLQQRRDDGSAGTRRRWLSVPAGALVFGTPAGQVPLGVAMVGVGLPGTEVVEIGRDGTRGILTRSTADARAALRAAIETWSGALGQQMPDVYRQGAVTRLSTPGRTDIAAGTSAAPSEGTTWVQVREGSYSLAGAPSVGFDADDVVLPLTQPMSLVALTDCTVEVTDSTDLDEGRLWLGVSRIVGLALAAHTADMGRTDARLQGQSATDDRREEQAFRTLASVLGTASVTGPSPDAGNLTWLQIALDRVGDVLDVSFPRLFDIPLERGGDALDIACDAAHVRSREVHLPDRWWKETAGPLLMFRGADRKPVAVVARTSRRYRWFDPETGQWQNVDADFVRSVQSEAVSFYERFPPGAITPRVLLRFALRGTRRSLTTILMFGFLVAMISLVVPLATKIVFDQVIPDGSISLLLTVTAMFAGAAVTISALTLSESFATLRMTGQVQATLQPALWDRLLRLSSGFFRRYTTGDLANRVDGVDTIRQVLTGQALKSVLTLMFSFVSVVLLFILSWQLAIVVCAVLVVVFGGLIALNLWRVRYIRRVMTIRGSVSGLVFQLLESVPKIRVAGAEDRALRAWAEAYRPQIEAGYTAGIIEAWLQGAGASATALIAVAAYWVAGTALIDISTGTFLAFTTALGQIVASLTTFNTQLTAMVECIPLYERLLPITQAELESSPDAAEPGELAGRIDIEGVTFRYEKDGALILDDVSITAAPGEFLAITGPSGAGKSTILRLLLAFETPDAGRVLYDGKDLAGLDLVAVRRQIGTVLQEDIPATGPIWRVILGDSGGTMDDAWRAAEAADIADDIRAMPMGLETVVTEGGATFSMGQIQRINIARAIARGPHIVLMDEATSALDNKTQETVSDALDGLDATRIVIAHRLSTIRAADRIVVLDHGRVVQNGTYEELMAVPGLFRDLARRQLAGGSEERAVAGA